MTDNNDTRVEALIISLEQRVKALEAIVADGLRGRWVEFVGVTGERWAAQVVDSQGETVFVRGCDRNVYDVRLTQIVGFGSSE